MVGISAVTFVVFYRRLGFYTFRAEEPLCENMTSSTKPEVHNLSQRPQTRTEPRPWATWTMKAIIDGRLRPRCTTHDA